MPHFTLINATAAQALVMVTRDGSLTACVPINAGDTVYLPDADAYRALARVTLEDGDTYASNSVAFSGHTQDLTAEVIEQDGGFAFRLSQAPGSIASGVTLLNRANFPVAFEIAIEDTPFSSVTLVDEDCDGFVGTGELHSFCSIVDGITTDPIVTPDTELTVEVYSDGAGEYAMKFVERP
jgi:hypothetical protein